MPNKTSSYVLTVTLNPALDRVVSHGKNYDFAGGKGINVARSLSLFNVSHCATGLIGGSTGQQIKSILRKEKIAFHFQSIKGNTRTNKTKIASGKTTASRNINDGPLISRVEAEKFLLHYEKLLKRALIVVISGRLARGLPDDYYRQLIDLAHHSQVACILDSHGAPFKQGLLSKPTMITPNRREAREVLRRPLKELRAVKTDIRFFHDFGIQYVILTMGEQGAISSNQKVVLHAKSPSVKVIDDVGCGDAFIAGWIYARLKNYAFKAMLKYATAFGCANTLSIKPGDFDPNMIKSLIRQTKILRL